MDSYARDVQTMRRFIETSRQKRREHLAAQLVRARADFRLITDHIIERYRPERIYQWGSLVDGAGFQEISDIDVAIEGLAQPQEFFHLLGECEELTTFPLHIVNLEEIPARIDQAVAILEEMSARIDHFEAETLPVLGRTNDAVLIPVQLIENGYTAVETLFVRISQAFENNLDQHRWHSHLLEKMTLEIAGVRPRIISDQLYRNLAELMRLRHFKRYYFALDYDWRKVDLLLQIFRESLPLLKEELQAFSRLVTVSLPASEDGE